MNNLKYFLLNGYEQFNHMVMTGGADEELEDPRRFEVPPMPVGDKDTVYTHFFQDAWARVVNRGYAKPRITFGLFIEELGIEDKANFDKYYIGFPNYKTGELTKDDFPIDVKDTAIDEHLRDFKTYTWEIMHQELKFDDSNTYEKSEIIAASYQLFKSIINSHLTFTSLPELQYRCVYTNLILNDPYYSDVLQKLFELIKDLVSEKDLIDIFKKSTNKISLRESEFYAHSSAIFLRYVLETMYEKITDNPKNFIKFLKYLNDSMFGNYINKITSSPINSPNSKTLRT